MRYFQTSVPASVLYAGGDAPVKWISADGITGWYRTDDPGILRFLDKLIESRANGSPQGPPFEEITREKYEDELGKSNGKRFVRDREYISASGHHPAQEPGVAVPVVEVKIPAPTPVPETLPELPPTQPPAPNIRKRK